ncbi:hypothetical protein [Salinicola peritrichatus]|uniref:hypothetical protein n=1 Tax=Salinicola peritrichatus TaxID=1267424 RepID=UPI000DA16B7D|nr:hypothetical protein [Salinicola peritrichatus]
MHSDILKKRLAKDRPMTTVTLRVPVDVVESLKKIAPLKGFQGYQTLLKAYVSEGLRRDEAQYLDDSVVRLVESLKAQGVSPEVIERAVNDMDLAH